MTLADIAADAERIARTALDNTQTSTLLDAYRRWPTAAVQDELESRGIVLWDHGLTPVSTACKHCGAPGHRA